VPEASGSTVSSVDTVHVTVVHDELTFDSRQALRLKEIERKLIEDTKRKKRDWERDVEKMREEFLTLYPCDEQSPALPDDTVSGLIPSSASQEGLVSKRRGSTDILDSKKMKTLFLEYPDAGRRYKIRFNVAGFDPERLRVATDGNRIIVRGTRREPLQDSNGGHVSSSSAVAEVEREYERKIEKPREVDAAKLKSYLTTDGILIIEAPVPPKSLNLRRTNQSSGSPQRGGGNAAALNSHHGSTASLRSASPATAAAASGSGGGGGGQGPSTTTGASGSVSALPILVSGQPPGSPNREKLGVPTFYEDQGRRKMALVVDVGTSFGPKEITALIIKDNRIQIKARHEERTLEKLCKNKYTKEFELAERIETYSLRSGLSPDGRLYVGALAKGHAGGLSKVGAGELVEDDILTRAPDNQSCNMLDLSSFPPTTPQLIASSSSYNSG